MRDTYWTSDEVETDLKEHMHEEFVRDLAIALYKTRNNSKSASKWDKKHGLASCDYHDHDD